MFCDFLRDNNENNHNNCNQTTSSSIINFNLAVAESFLAELTFWEPSISIQYQEESYTNDPIMSPLEQTLPSDYQSTEPTTSSSSGACAWKTAVDPRSNQTYYYHTVTRETQWEKPAEIRALEKQARRERRKRDRLFFREMEQNIYASLERGELIPPSKKENKDNAESSEIKTTEVRARTISGMDNVLLAQLEKPKTVVRETSTSSTGTGIRPPVKGRPPRPLASVSSSRQGSIGSKNKNNMNDSLDVSSDESTSGFSRRDSNERLAGEHLLDGPIEDQIKLDGSLLPKPVHLRRNTGGTIFVKSTMTSPNIEATIKCVCGVFRAHILQSLSKRPELNSPPSVTVRSLTRDSDVFFDDFGSPEPLANRKKVPSLEDICTFYQDFYNNSQMEHDTIIMSLIYVERLIKEASLSPNCNNWRSVLFSCMVLASKVWDDLSMWNIDFSHVCGKRHKNAFSAFTLGRINDLELALLKSLHFNVKVPASEYAKYYFLIRSMLIKSGLLDEVVGRKQADDIPLNMQGAKNLETLSSNYQESFVSRQEMNGMSKSRRSKSMDGYFWFSSNQSEQEAQPESRQPASATNKPCGNVAVGPVLNQSVCLEQLVTM